MSLTSRSVAIFAVFFATSSYGPPLQASASMRHEPLGGSYLLNSAYLEHAQKTFLKCGGHSRDFEKVKEKIVLPLSNLAQTADLAPSAQLVNATSTGGSSKKPRLVYRTRNGGISDTTLVEIADASVCGFATQLRN